ncbi:MAG: carboxylating nicotinate-nucleotide diphosphorylase [Legionellales bacterium]
MSIDTVQVRLDVIRVLLEDVGTGDVTSALLPANLQVQADIISRQPMLVCGQAWVNSTFHQMDSLIDIKWHVKEGEYLIAPKALCTLSGEVRTILTAERTALNFLQTLSATATQTHQYVQKLQGTTARLLDTRKTIPGLRVAQKYAVQCGGGVNHRMGLYDAFLIKENHIKACGSVTNAIRMAREKNGHLLVEIEVETLEELQQAISAQPDRILLDNFTLDMLAQAVSMNQPKSCELEASGGINLDTIAAVAATGVDYISVGAITKSIEAIDLSLLIRDLL